MTHKELFTLLKTLNIPVAYDHFESNKDINPPFVVYRETRSNTFKADGKTYFRPYNFEIEVVSIKKDMELQNKVEKLLDDNNIPYDVIDEIWDDDEKIYHNLYEV